MTLDEAIALLEGVCDRRTVEDYVRRTWVRPAQESGGWRFEEIDVARIRLVYELQALRVGDEAMEVILPLIDQLHGLHARFSAMAEAIGRQPRHIQAEIFTCLTGDTEGTSAE